MWVAWDGRAAGNQSLGAAQTTGGPSCHVPLSPCPSHAWRSPASCPWGGRARSPRDQAVPGSVCHVRGPCQTDGPIVQCVGSPAEGGTGAKLGGCSGQSCC